MEEKGIVARVCLPPEPRCRGTTASETVSVPRGGGASRRWCLTAVVPRGGGASRWWGSGGRQSRATIPFSSMLWFSLLSNVSSPNSFSTMAENQYTGIILQTRTRPHQRITPNQTRAVQASDPTSTCVRHCTISFHRLIQIVWVTRWVAYPNPCRTLAEITPTTSLYLLWKFQRRPRTRRSIKFIISSGGAHSFWP